MVLKPRARGHSKAVLLAAAVLALAAALASVGRSPGVHGLLADREAAVASFQAARITDIAVVLPGKATAGAFHEGSPEPVARAGPDGLVRELDFGTNNVDSGRNFPDVLRIVNVSGNSLAVEWRYEGGIAGCFRETAGALELAPGGVASLDSQLVHQGVDPGLYEGTLVIGVRGYSYRLPARITMVQPPPERRATQDGGGKEAGAAGPVGTDGAASQGTEQALPGNGEGSGEGEDDGCRAVPASGEVTDAGSSETVPGEAGSGGGTDAEADMDAVAGSGAGGEVGVAPDGNITGASVAGSVYGGQQ